MRGGLVRAVVGVALVLGVGCGDESASFCDTIAAMNREAAGSAGSIAAARDLADDLAESAPDDVRGDAELVARVTRARLDAFEQDPPDPDDPFGVLDAFAVLPEGVTEEQVTAAYLAISDAAERDCGEPLTIAEALRVADRVSDELDDRLDEIPLPTGIEPPEIEIDFGDD